MSANVLDVSEHQGKITWNLLKGKIAGAIIRIGYGNDRKDQDDLYAAYNMRECGRLGIPFDVYIYSHANSMSMIRSEIEHTKRMCKGYSPIRYWLDLEERGNKAFWNEAAKEWKKAFGKKAGVYSWQWGFEQHVKGIDVLKWVCAYGRNTGKPDTAYKPTIPMDLWQFTSKGRLPGVSGDVDLSECYISFGGEKPAEVKPTRRVVTKKEVAALIMRHMCTHNKHGYTQDMSGRQGTGTETIDIYGKKYIIKGGDRDCSKAVIDAYEAAGISCGGATYTGNMSKCMTSTGNFVRRSMKFVAQMGDSYLVHDEKRGRCHTAMCLSAEPDVLMEFSINEKGGTLGGRTGDQLQKGEYDETYGRGESHLKMYYDYPWDCILQCVNDEIAFTVEADGTITGPGKDDGYSGTVKKNEKTTEDLAIEVMFGCYGNDKERETALGSKKDAVQKTVNGYWYSKMPDFIEAMKGYLTRHGASELIKKR